MYWGGLIELIAHYWAPKGGLIAKAEKDILKDVSRFCGQQGGDTAALNEIFRYYLEDLAEKRKSFDIQTPNKQAIHDWIKEETGYYKWVQAPAGLRKELLSINFNAMSQEEFTIFYKKAFSVTWRFILSRNFESQEDMQNAINQLMAMG